MSFLSPQQIATFQTDGFLLIPNFANEEMLRKMKEGAAKIIDRFELDQVRIFTTENQSQVLDKYFLESGDKVSCFFEEEAFDAEGNLTREKHLSVNKIGHALHDCLPEFEAYSYQPNLLALAKDLGLERPQIVQSQYIYKQPQIGAKVNAHTDSTFLHTQPLSCLGAWLAIEPATIANGCLSFIPGSHRDYPLQERYIRNSTETGTEFVATTAERVLWPLDQLKALEVEAGTLVLLSGEVVHASYANRSEKSRQSYILHIVDGNCRWSPDNWLQRPPENPFRDLEMVVSQQ